MLFMRWQAQTLDEADTAALPGMRRMAGLVRTVQTPEFRGVTFHEVRAKSALNKVPGESAMPFRWTVNPWRGCTHACFYCYARASHTWLDFDAGRDFDTQIVVKTNIAEVLRRELTRPSWTHEHVALGTNTDPYQRAEGRYRLMPGIIAAFTEHDTPFSILTKGTVLRRDLPTLTRAAERVPVGLGVSLAVLDPQLQALVEPGTPGPQARLELIRAIAGAGLDCGVFVAPVLPWLTDSTRRLDELLGRIAAAGASGATILPLHLRKGSREWFFGWLRDHRPDLVPRYRRLYAGGAYVSPDYKELLHERVAPLLARHGLDRSGTRAADDGYQQPSAATATDEPSGGAAATLF